MRWKTGIRVIKVGRVIRITVPESASLAVDTCWLFVGFDFEPGAMIRAVEEEEEDKEEVGKGMDWCSSSILFEASYRLIKVDMDY